jgi:aspartyl-tRNA(Asn)/glutamyl-tRNA(Gln) amidotransferase subunit A
LTLDEAREDARRVDSLIAQGKPVGRLAGVPFAVKDNLTVRGVVTTAGSKMLHNWVSPYTATVVELLRKEGAVLMGKTNMDEFAMGDTTEHSAYGETSNPWDCSRVPGGSSGGSAAAVAAGFLPFSLGSETSGSVRQPAAFCGIQGFKPTYGMVSRYGLIAYGSSIDQIGVFTRNLKDLELVMQIISSPDEKDLTNAIGLHSTDFKGGKIAKRIGIVKEFMDFKIDPAIREAQERTIEFLRSSGMEIVEISLPVTSKYTVPCYYAIAVSEANTNLARYDGVRYGHSVKDASSLSDLYTRTRTQGFGIEVKCRILAGTYLTNPDKYKKYYIPALKIRHLIASEFAGVFSEVDSILQPVAPILAPRKGEYQEDPLIDYTSLMYTAPATLAGLPALSFNAGNCSKTGLPVGLQLIGKRWSDPDLIATAKLLESNFGEPKMAKGAI